MIEKLLRALSLRSATPPSPLPFHLGPGQLVSVLTEEGEAAVMKVLAVDEQGVHARLYVQRFPSRPTIAELPQLSLAPLGPGQSHPFSIGHMPLSYRSFLGWEPELVSQTDVSEEELEGYRMWEEARGGYF